MRGKAAVSATALGLWRLHLRAQVVSEGLMASGYVWLSLRGGLLGEAAWGILGFLGVPGGALLLFKVSFKVSAVALELGTVLILVCSFLCPRGFLMGP